MNRDTTSQAYFESKYRQNPDPWQFASSEYEQGRYDATVQAVASQRFQRAFEPGCSIGMLTVRLATICDQVEAMDISPTAVEQARQTCRHLPSVHITCGALPALPEGTFDLIVLSEIGYYFRADQLFELSKALLSRLRSPGTLLATHWLGHSKDHLLSGDRVHQILASLDGLQHSKGERTVGYRLDRWDRA